MPEYHPPVDHYNRGAIQPIDFMESNFTPDEYRGFLKGQVIKYIARYRYKGNPLDDLAKAKTYLDWLIEFEGKQPKPRHWMDDVQEAMSGLWSKLLGDIKKERKHEKTTP